MPVATPPLLDVSLGPVAPSSIFPPHAMTVVHAQAIASAALYVVLMAERSSVFPKLRESRLRREPKPARIALRP